MGKVGQKGCRPDTLLGAWAIEPSRLEAMVDVFRSSDLAEVQAASRELEAPEPYHTDGNGIATVNLTGPMSKYPTSFQAVLGGTSTLLTKKALADADRDPRVKAVMLRVDSPGGTVAGTGDLADAVRGMRKPVHAYVDDLAASAAYWVASAADKITAGPSSEVGSIGTFAVLTDSSGRYEKEGIRVHVVSAGKFKGAGTPGSQITDEQLAESQRRVEALNELFLGAVSEGRSHAGLTPARVRDLADGRVHVAHKAKEYGLVDAVAPFDAAMAELARSVMAEEQNAALVAENERLKAEAAAAASLAERLAKAEAQIAETEARERLASCAAKVKALDKLPSIPELPAAILAIEAAAPDAAQVLWRQLNAWNAQTDTAALFKELGTSQGPKGTDYSAMSAAERTAELRRLAQKRVEDGKSKNLADAMVAVAKDNPALMRREEK